ncbi:MAG: transcriptional regulator GcvA [Ectothiorhodospiraceae bacterium]|jgi:LysR family glycine cleavage system transcriptional activator
MRRLPPLNSVRAFEAAARHTSFAAAADELSVTASAVSQQVKALEDWLGLALFSRTPRGLLLTDAGRRYLPALTEALDRVDRATRQLFASESARVITVTVTPSLGTQWLVPHLWEYSTRNPGVDVRISATERTVDLTREDVDLAVRLGRGAGDGVVSEFLIRDTVAPVCAPALVGGEYPLKHPADLQHHRLLHMDDPLYNAGVTTWQEWLEAAGAGEVDASVGPRFSVWYLAIMEAVAGRGVALGPRSLVGEELRAGRLVAPFDLWLPAGVDYYVAYREGALERPALAAFRDWLFELCARE